MKQCAASVSGPFAHRGRHSKSQTGCALTHGSRCGFSTAPGAARGQASRTVPLLCPKRTDCGSHSWLTARQHAVKVSACRNKKAKPCPQFKNADVIGHPASLFSSFASASGYACEGAGTALMPYLLSTLDTLAWRYNVPKMVYPEALMPGVCEIGTRAGRNLWGNVYPRGGFLHQSDDYKAGAVVAQRAGDIVTRRNQSHVYQPLLASARDGYWPAGALVEGDAATGKWQELTPTLSSSCAVFPHGNAMAQAQRGDYAWALWRPYSCCERRGQVFLGSVDFN
jgi:integrating conjugative element protein (TIGR03756 family)